jgi:hypothetical protein
MPQGDDFMPHPQHARNSSIRLILFPGESQKGLVVSQRTRTVVVSVTVGHIYVIDGSGRVIDSYEMTGGPPPEVKSGNPKEQGGHTAGITPPGHYVLAEKEHHVTANWPYSVVPFGAKLREVDGVVQYQMNLLGSMQADHMAG